MNARLPAMTPIEKPPPTTLPYDARSAWMPKTPCTPRGWARKPVTTSSKISTEPDCSVSARSSRRNSTGRKSGRRDCTGSTMIAASSWARSFRIASDSGVP
jgi:hypothetical protein